MWSPLFRAEKADEITNGYFRYAVTHNHTQRYRIDYDEVSELNY